MNEQRNSRVGIVGGTFNPIHNAHLSIAEHFLDAMRLDIVFFVPASISPFKTDNYPPQEISSEHRIKMLELAIKDYKKFSIDTFETDKGDVSYTIDTVKYFREKFPYSKLFLLIGDDQVKDFHRWKNWEEILSEVQLCIARRSKKSLNPEFIAEQNIKLKSGGRHPVWLKNDLVHISSTEIRAKINTTFLKSEMLPKSVEKYILKNKLY